MRTPLPNVSSRRRFWPCLVLASCSWAASAHADVFIDAIVTPLGSSFRYEFSISNNEAEDLALVSIVDVPLGDALIGTSLITPTGFLSSYDGGLGIVDFLSDAELFAAGLTLGGFSFESLTGPGAFFTKFEALSLGGTSFAGAVRSTVVPDAGSTLAALGLAACALTPLIRRR
jgi:hypothetical protein